MHVIRALLCIGLPVILSGCSSPKGNAGAERERGPEGTYAYNVPIESSLPGTRIEVNYKVIGTAPVTVKIFGDRDGTFHNFGSDEYTVRGYPPDTNHFPQTKIFRTGAFSIKDDRIPEKIFFDFSEPIKK